MILHAPIVYAKPTKITSYCLFEPALLMIKTKGNPAYPACAVRAYGFRKQNHLETNKYTRRNNNLTFAALILTCGMNVISMHNNLYIYGAIQWRNKPSLAFQNKHRQHLKCCAEKIIFSVGAISLKYDRVLNAWYIYIYIYQIIICDFERWVHRIILSGLMRTSRYWQNAML